LLAVKSSMIEKVVMGFLIKHPTLRSHLRAFANTHKVLPDNQRIHPHGTSKKSSLGVERQNVAANATIQEIDIFSSKITPPLSTEKIMARLEKELAAVEINAGK
jgi:hypothetical protein